MMTNRFSKAAPLQVREPIIPTDAKNHNHFDQASAQTETALQENVFHSMLTLERRRAERSRKPFVLMLLDANLEDGSAAVILEEAADIIMASKRETDLVGWYKKSDILGVIFTEVSIEGERPLTEILRAKIDAALARHLGREKAAKIAISLHMFPEIWDRDNSDWVADAKFYPDFNRGNSRKRLPLVIKRMMDIAGSAALLLALSPLLAVIAAIIKLTSKGPVIFQQERLGRFGARFKCLKFRTMFTNNDPKIHQEFIQQFISGKEECGKEKESQQSVYKIMNDPRVTPIGAFLRRTSLDELPQFWNVLRGEMSLVGPRPPVPYEFEIYDIWHRRRVLDIKLGVTGLWQVSGRSRTRFDDMVRLDLRYCQTWSLWLDLRILISTPRAVFGGDGAY
jgi:lipopolysaccharide/colanic/teichoic acid biosynthesis glycosyltransferase